MAPSLRTGVDLVTVADVVESAGRFGDRYLTRIFTDHELASCFGDPPPPGQAWSSGAPLPWPVAQSLAARFAAKEATLKVLRPPGPRPPWRTIEVHRAPDGGCDLVLSGEAARLAAASGLSDLAVSLTHEAGLACAVVVAIAQGAGSGSGTGAGTGSGTGSGRTPESGLQPATEAADAPGWSPPGTGPGGEPGKSGRRLVSMRWWGRHR